VLCCAPGCMGPLEPLQNIGIAFQRRASARQCASEVPPTLTSCCTARKATSPLARPVQPRCAREGAIRAMSATQGARAVLGLRVAAQQAAEPSHQAAKSFFKEVRGPGRRL